MAILGVLDLLKLVYDVTDEALSLVCGVLLLEAFLSRLICKLKVEGEFVAIDIPWLLVED